MISSLWSAFVISTTAGLDSRHWMLNVGPAILLSCPWNKEGLVITLVAFLADLHAVGDHKAARERNASWATLRSCFNNHGYGTPQDTMNALSDDSLWRHWTHLKPWKRLHRETWVQDRKTPFDTFEGNRPGMSFNDRLLWRQFSMNRPGKSVNYRLHGDTLLTNPRSK